MLNLLLLINCVDLEEIRSKPQSFSTKLKIKVILKQLKKVMRPLNHKDPIIFADSLLKIMPHDKPILYSDNILEKILAIYDSIPEETKKGEEGWMINELWQSVDTQINTMVTSQLCFFRRMNNPLSSKISSKENHYLDLINLLDMLFPGPEDRLRSNVSHYISDEEATGFDLPLEEIYKSRANGKIDSQKSIHSFTHHLILGLYAACMNYQRYLKDKVADRFENKHLSEKSNPEGDGKKIKILDRLCDILLKPRIRPQEKLIAFKDSFLAHQTILETNTETIGKRFLNFIKKILSFGFWKSEQEVFLQRSNILPTQS